MSNPVHFRLLVSPYIVDDLAGAIHSSITEQRRAPGMSTSPDETEAVQVHRESVAGQSIETLCALIIAAGGGTGLAAIIVGIAKAIAIVRDKNPKAKVVFDKKGRLQEITGYSVAEIYALLRESSPDEGQATRPTVQACGTSDRRLLDLLHNPLNGDYFAPVLPSETFTIRNHFAPATSSHSQVMAILDTGIMTHHPWVRGRIRKMENFTKEKGIEDRNGHGTLVALRYFQGFAQVAGSLDGAWLMVGKVLNEDASGAEEDLKAGIRWAAENGATMINLSVAIYRPNGCAPDCELCALVEDVDMKGIIVTIAQGNDPDRVSCPQPRGRYTIKVGSAMPDGTPVLSYTVPGPDFLYPVLSGFRKISSDGS